MEDTDKKILLNYLAPFFVGTIIVSVFLTLLTFKYVPAFKNLGAPKVVVFDITKFVTMLNSKFGQGVSYKKSINLSNSF